MSKSRFLIILAISMMLFSPAPAWSLQHVVIADFSLGVDENASLYPLRLSHAAGRRLALAYRPPEVGSRVGDRRAVMCGKRLRYRIKSEKNGS